MTLLGWMECPGYSGLKGVFKVGVGPKLGGRWGGWPSGESAKNKSFRHPWRVAHLGSWCLRMWRKSRKTAGVDDGRSEGRGRWKLSIPALLSSPISKSFTSSANSRLTTSPVRSLHSKLKRRRSRLVVKIQKIQLKMSKYQKICGR